MLHLSFARCVISNQFKRLYSSVATRAEKTIVNSPEQKREKSDKEVINEDEHLNEVHLIGRVGQDPIIETLNEVDQSKIFIFSLATNSYFTNKSEIKEHCDWHRIVLLSPDLQNFAQQNVRKGVRLHVSGELRNFMFKDNNNGKARFVTSIFANNLILVKKKKEN